MDELWNLVNNASSQQDVTFAEVEIKNADISIEDFNDLMSALSYVSRELYRR